jgi:hypothetical protein
MRALATLVSLSLSVLTSVGCGTLSIGRGPTDLDLRNDGSAEAQQALQKKYALAYRPFSIERPGASTDEVAAEIQERVAEVRTAAWSDEAADYLATSVAAEELIDTTPVSFDRFAHGPVPTTMLFVGSVLVGSGLGMASAVNVGSVNGGTVADVSWGALNGAVGGMFFAVPLMIVYQLTIPLLSASLASSDYKRAVRAFNKDLEVRIVNSAEAHKPAPEVTAPAPLSTPAAQPPPAEGTSSGAPNPAPEGSGSAAPQPADTTEQKPNNVP